MDGLNKVMLIGNLGKDPEMRYTANGNAVANFSMAVSRSRGSGESRTEETEWFTVVLWEKQAEFVAQYAAKGQKVYVEGRLATRTWDKDGVKQFRTEVVGEKVMLLSRNDKQPVAAGVQEEMDPDDLPFD